MATNNKRKFSIAVPPVERPKVSGFKQQNLPAWQPILKGRTASPLFLITGLFFIPIGVVLLIISQRVKEYCHDYTYCMNKNSPNTTCAEFLQIADNAGKVCYCSIKVVLETFNKPVFIHYGLTNYYQNHRRYVRSRDDTQLNGHAIAPQNLRTECDPFRIVTINGSVYGYAPCGAIANTIFNDSFSLKYQGNIHVDLLKTGIAWKSDKEIKFRNPKSWASYVKPTNWKEPVWKLDPDLAENNGYLNEDLIVWMRTAALPHFRKLYRRVNHTADPFFFGLPAGAYLIDIEYKYPVASFGGRKRIFISTTSIMGGKNPFLGFAYISVGIINIAVGILFIISMIFRKTSEIAENEDTGVNIVRGKRNKGRPKKAWRRE